MENASKALIIVGGVLIGVMILSMFLYVFRAAAKTNQSYDEKQAQEQLETYNAKYEVYNRNNNTIIDLLTVINLAYDNNVSCDYDPQNSVEILIKISANHFYRLLGKYENRNLNEKNKIRFTSGENIIPPDIDENKKSIYDLVNESFDELDIKTIGSADDKLSLTRLENNETQYKYLFKCTSIKYNIVSGKVEFMKFELDGPKY